MDYLVIDGSGHSRPRWLYKSINTLFPCQGWWKVAFSVNTRRFPLFRGTFFKCREAVSKSRTDWRNKLIFLTTNIHLSSDKCQANLINIIPGEKKCYMLCFIKKLMQLLISDRFSCPSIRSPAASTSLAKHAPQPNPTQQHNYATSGWGHMSTAEI